MREQVLTEMRRTEPRIGIGDISIRGGKLSFMVRDASQVDAARERLLSITGSGAGMRSEEHTSELQSLMRISYAVFCLKKKKQKHQEIVDNSKRIKRQNEHTTKYNT